MEPMWCTGVGEWIAIQGDAALVVVPPQSVRRAADVWVALETSTPSFEELLDVLLADGLSALPSFVLLVWGADGARALVRGTASVGVVEASGERHTLRAELSWAEQAWTAEAWNQLVAIEVEVPGGAPGEALLPTGVSRTGGVLFSRDELVPAAEPAASAPSVLGIEPETVPEPAQPSFAQPASAEETQADIETAPFAAAVLAEADLGGVDLGKEPAALDDEATLLDDDLPTSTLPPVDAGIAAQAGDLASESASAPASEDAVVTELLPADATLLESPAEGTPEGETRLLPPARLHFSHGPVVVLDQPLRVGRAPGARGGTPPGVELLTVPSPQGEISANHVDFLPGTGDQEGAVLINDLGSTNGTVVVPAGRPPVELQPGVPIVVGAPALVDLGDTVTVRIEFV